MTQSTDIVMDVVNNYRKAVGYLNEADARVQNKITAYLKARNDLRDELSSLKEAQADHNEMTDDLTQFIDNEERRSDGYHVP